MALIEYEYPAYHNIVQGVDRMSPQPSGAQHVPLLPVQFLAMFQEGNIINSIVLFNVCHVCSSICIFFYKKLLCLLRFSFFLPGGVLMATYQYWHAIGLVVVVTSIPSVWEQSLLRWRELRSERGVETLPWWRSIRKTWQSCSWLWKRWWQLWASCSSSETWEGFFQRCKAFTTLPTKPTTLSHYHCPLILIS